MITQNRFDSLQLCSMETCSVLFFYLKEQETVKMSVDDGAALQNISPSTSATKEISEPYLATNTLSR